MKSLSPSVGTTVIKVCLPEAVKSNGPSSPRSQSNDYRLNIRQCTRESEREGSSCPQGPQGPIPQIKLSSKQTRPREFLVWSLPALNVLKAPVHTFKKNAPYSERRVAPLDPYPPCSLVASYAQAARAHALPALPALLLQLFLWAAPAEPAHLSKGGGIQKG